MRWIIFKTISFFILLSTGLIYFISSTTLGLRVTLFILCSALNNQLVIDNVQGTLSQFTLGKLAFTYDKDVYQFNAVTIAWDPYAILNNRYAIHSIKMGKAYIDIKTSDDNSPFETAFLQPLMINRLQADNTVIIVNNQLIGNFNRLDITQQTANDYTIGGEVYGGNAKGTLHLEWAPVFKQTAAIEFSNLDLSRLSKKINGTIHFTLKNSILTKEKSMQYHTWMEGLNGNLRQFPIRGQASIQYENGYLGIEPSELTIANGYAKIAGNLSNRWALTWDVNIPELSQLLPELHGKLTTSGTLNGPRLRPVMTGKFQVQQFAAPTFQANTINGNMRLGADEKSMISMDAKNIAVKGQRIADLQLRATSQYRNNQLLSDITLSTDTHNELIGTLSLSRENNSTLALTPLRGDFNLHITSLQDLQKLTPFLTHPKGVVNGKLLMGGTLGNPEITATATLNNGEITIPKLGITIKNIVLNSRYEHESIATTGSFQSGNGRGNVQSKIEFMTPMQVSLTLDGKNLQLAKLREYKITVSPELTLTSQGKTVNIAGKIIVPTAAISPIDFSDTTTLSSDVVFVDAPPSQQILPSSLSIQLQLVLGNDVNLDYENLHAKVNGSVSISQTPGREPVAFGQLYLQDGTYKAYGTLLTIQNGRIVYTGNTLLNPGLDISATRKIKVIAMSNASQFNNITAFQPTYAGTNQVTVGVQVKGTIKKPATNLFSSPAGMSQNDILSYLLFGYPQSELSGDNKVALLSAAASLKMGNTSLGGFTNKIQNMTGLSELNVGSTQVFNPKTNTTQNATTLSVGKQLSPKLSVHSSVGLYSSAALLNIRYQLTKKITLQTETSSLENGVDLMIGFERD